MTKPMATIAQINKLRDMMAAAVWGASEGGVSTIGGTITVWVNEHGNVCIQGPMSENRIATFMQATTNHYGGSRLFYGEKDYVELQPLALGSKPSRADLKNEPAEMTRWRKKQEGLEHSLKKGNRWKKKKKKAK